MKKKFYFFFVLLFFIGCFLTIINTDLFKHSGVIAGDFLLDEQAATMRAIKNVRPAVVSIIVYDELEMENIDLLTGKRQIKKEKKEMGRGTGFIITPDGYIITNKHVVETARKESASFRVILNSGKQYYAQLIGKDPLKDLAVLKIFDKDLPSVKLGDSDKIDIGLTVIAIGNTLGRYQNSATKGIVSGLGRNIVAGANYGGYEVLDNVIQTDAEINMGNSGGPLIDLHGRVVGVNVAIANDAQGVAFSIPINDVRPIIQSIKESGLIRRPYLGVHYVMLTPEIALDNNLPRDNGAWISAPDSQDAPVVPGGPADKAGLLTGDIIFEVNAIKVTGINTLQSIIQRYKPNDHIGLKIQRGDKIIIREVILGELK